MLWRMLEIAFMAGALLFGGRWVYLLWTGPKVSAAHKKLDQAEEDDTAAQIERKARRTQQWADTQKDKPSPEERGKDHD